MATDASESMARAEMMEREAALSLAVEALAAGNQAQYDFGGQDPSVSNNPQQQAYGTDIPYAMEMDQVRRQQQQQQAALESMQWQQQLASAQASEEASITMRSGPEEHFLTISKNGTILGATETVTGIPPNSLLMTSIYDSVHTHDLVGLRAISSRYWDKGHPEVEAYLRRRTADDGDWLWLVAKVVSFIDVPVPGLIVKECLAPDARIAELVSRTCRISALLASAVEASRLRKKEDEEGGTGLSSVTGSDSRSGEGSGGVNQDALSTGIWSTLGGSADDAAVMEALIGADQMAASGGNEALQQNAHQQEQEALVGAGDGEERDIDPANPLFSVMSLVRSGVCLDLSKILMTSAESKMVTLVLCGRIQIEDLGTLVGMALNSPTKDLSTALDSYVLEQEVRSKQKQQHHQEATAGHHRDKSRRKRSFGTTNAIATGQLLFGGSPARPPTSSSVMRSSAIIFDAPAPTSPTNPLRRAQSSPCPPPLSALNLSYTNIGSLGLEMLSEVLYTDSPMLKTIDIGFCGVEERGLLVFCRALRRRKDRGLPQLQGLVLSGNVVSYKAAKELGEALSSAPEKKPSRKRGMARRALGRDGDGTGYDEDDEWDDDDEEEYDEILFGSGVGRSRAKDRSKDKRPPASNSKGSNHATRPDKYPAKQEKQGLLLLHLACTSLTPDSLYQLLIGMGQDAPLKELDISSNDLGSEGATVLVSFLEGKGIVKYKKGQPVMKNLDRLDISNNKLGNDGITKLTRAMSKRANVHFADLRLSYNDIGASGIETIMNKLLQHNLRSLSLDNNTISDRGCQLVAASLPSMNQLTRLSLSFNQIGSRGVNTLMRALLGCESIMYLGMSGNVMKISGAIAMGFALSQHPRLSELDLENCCLSQVSQCHIVAGIISNRWVPMKSVSGFRVGPPMVAIGALDLMAQHLSNEECFRIRRDIQMKTILQWMETNRQNKCSSMNEDNVFTSACMSNSNEVSGVPSQSAYLRMLDWLSRIPFDEDELADLRSYFYDPDGGGDNERGSDGNINLRLRGDLLAALGSEVVDEIREDAIYSLTGDGASIGMDLSHLENKVNSGGEIWSTLQRCSKDNVRSMEKDEENQPSRPDSSDAKAATDVCGDSSVDVSLLTGKVSGKRGRKQSSDSLDLRRPSSFQAKEETKECPENSFVEHRRQRSSFSVDAYNNSTSNLSRASSQHSGVSNYERGRGGNAKARIDMFRPFARKLEMLKAHAQDMMDQEPDPMQQDIIAQQFAEASLTLLRQLRYHCMNSGLGGWRQGKLRRKVLIVDDSMVTRKMVSRAFERANFVVDTAENGQEGVAKLKESIYDIAFMDIDMPVMNGFDATIALRQWEDLHRPGARQPICALTAAYVDDFERSELMKFKEAGLDVMESKPCNIPRLFKVVDDVSPMFSDLSINVTQNPAAT